MASSANWNWRMGGGGRRIKIFEKQKKEALVMVMYNFAKKVTPLAPPPPGSDADVFSVMKLIYIQEKVFDYY